MKIIDAVRPFARDGHQWFNIQLIHDATDRITTTAKIRHSGQIT